MLNILIPITSNPTNQYICFGILKQVDYEIFYEIIK